MKTADLYVRVSTDEQADRGYSQRDQEERLRKYCNINNIVIHKVIFEDHSAKTFNRPQWSKLLAEVKRSKGKRNLILFTKWDRFSRNTGDAYGMIAILRKYGVEPQAVEQPLDMSVPENKMMLAFYLAAPEVENDRRALNTFHGMRRAKKEGRWMSTAPLGYKNCIAENGRKHIEPREPQASLMKWAFEEIAKDNYGADQIRKMALKKGLKCPRMHFWRLVRNPVYCGKIIVPQYKDEDATMVNGLHEPLISEALFYEVQDVLLGRSRKKALKVVSLDHLPLRGLIHCPNCHRMLTGSKSKGKCKHYYYYHCVNECGIRFNAIQANDIFSAQLKEITLRSSTIELLKLVITKVHKSRTQNDFNDKKLVLDGIEKQNGKLSKAREFLLSGDIEPMDYKLIKAECEEQIRRLEAKMTAVTAQPLVKMGVEKLTEKVINVLSKLDQLYLKADIAEKRRIICCLYPNKLQFDGKSYRTLQSNAVVDAILLINNELAENKKGKEDVFQSLSLRVARRGIEPLFPE